jgi:hypothetical protein
MLQNFWFDNFEERRHFRDLEVDGIIILIYMYFTEVMLICGLGSSGREWRPSNRILEICQLAH